MARKLGKPKNTKSVKKAKTTKPQVPVACEDCCDIEKWLKKVLSAELDKRVVSRAKVEAMIRETLDEKFGQMGKALDGFFSKLTDAICQMVAPGTPAGARPDAPAGGADEVGRAVGRWESEGGRPTPIENPKSEIENTHPENEACVRGLAECACSDCLATQVNTPRGSAVEAEQKADA